MPIKSAKYTYGGMNQDQSRSKHNPSLYFNGKHIRINSEDSQTTGSVSNEKGTKQVFSIPTNVNINQSTKTIEYSDKSISYTNNNISNLNVSNDHKILGSCVTKNSIILITTSTSLDCIWEVKDIYKDTYDVNLLYVGNLGFSINNPIQLIYNYENEINEKIYWVDGKNQLRFINLRHSIENGDKENLIDLDPDLINTVGNISMSQAFISGISQGGVHTSGMIQYTYNLYKTNLSQTTLSPFTKLIPLSKNVTEGGGDVNEVVGSIPIVQIDNIDRSYTNIKVYAIKYTSLNETPSISIIADRSIPDNGTITIYDDGNVISNISIEELAFLGSEPIVPKHIESKDNQLFLFNTKENSYSIEGLDTRAYSFNSSSVSRLANSQNPLVNGVPSGSFLTVPSNYIVNPTHDSINPDYKSYKYQSDGSTLGGEGKYIKYELLTTTTKDDTKQYLKSEEIYRISIEFFNNKGQRTLPEWIADFIAPNNNLNGKYNILSVTLKPEFYTFINNLPEQDRPVGYKVLRANRTISDRTVLCQGPINGMIANKIDGNQKWYPNRSGFPEILFDQQVIKYPSLIRTFDTILPILEYKDFTPLAYNNVNSTGFNALDDNADSEGAKAESSEDWRGQLFQFNKLMQMYSPDIIFDNVVPDRSFDLYIKGIKESTSNQAWNAEISTVSKTVNHSGKIDNGVTHITPGASVTTITGDPSVPSRRGIFGRSGDDNVNNYFQFYREFSGDFEEATNKRYSIYGSPEAQVLGQGIRSYNSDSDFRYSNNYQSILQDNNMQGSNSNSIRSITIVEGPDDDNFNNQQRRSLEDIYNENNFNISNGLIIAELKKPESYIYEGNIYGGNNFEAKRRTDYIEIGDYKDITVNVNTIDSPGDTFVQDFIFTKISKADTTISTSRKIQITEIVSIPVETIVDLKNRNDNSLDEWDSVFQPSYVDFQKYNRVYNQKENIFKKRNVDANFKEVNNFGTTILSSKKKIAGELIDSWTDLLINETMDLDGKYGSINGTINFKDQIFTFQDKAVAAISINPRVQTQASDGLSLELGTGRVLQDYKYLTTNSGSINKWGIVAGNRGFYYYDNLNKALYRSPDSTEVSLSDAKGLRTLFDNNHDFNGFSIDNPLLQKGVVLGYDNYNKDVFITLNSDNVQKTLVFSEKNDQFIDEKLYYPKIYIDSSHKFMATEDISNIHKLYEGNYNEYFGRNIESSITLMVNPEADLDCIFNNIIFKSQVSLNGIDKPSTTISYIRAYNEYQDSGRVDLVNRSNIARKFRDWKAFIPREGRDRIRNPWMFLELGFHNEENLKLVLHDINVLYTI